MAEFFERDCEFCGSRIRMAQMDDGQWLAFELEYNGGRHKCRSKPSVVTEGTSRRSSDVAEPSRQSFSDRPLCDPARSAKDSTNEENQRSQAGCLMGCMALLIVIVGVTWLLAERVYSFFFAT